jgi:hypothetical protein
MKQGDVIVGGEYMIQLESKPVRVKVIRDCGTRDGHAKKFRVQRVDNGRILSKLRTSQSLYPITTEHAATGHE